MPPGRSSLDGCLLALIRHASSFPAGTFVFVVSDFIDAVSPGIWLKLRALRWDVTPVVVQDPTWEQSFPDVGGVLLPDPRRDVRRGRRGPGQRTRGARPGASQRAPPRVRARRSSRGSGSTRSCSAAASRRQSPRASTGGRAGAGACAGEAREARTRCDRGVRPRRRAVGVRRLTDDRRPGRPGECPLRRHGRLRGHGDGRRVARRQRPHRERCRTIHAGRAGGRGAIGLERRRAHHGHGDDRLPLRRLPRGRGEEPSPCRGRASRPAARSPSRPASRWRWARASAPRPSRRRSRRSAGRRACPARPTAFAPSIAEALLALLGIGLLAVGAIVLTAPLRRSRADARRAVHVDQRERAVRLLRESATRDADDRRRAASLASRVVGEPELARTAAGVAWSRPEPGPPDATTLADRVEHSPAGRA